MKNYTPEFKTSRAWCELSKSALRHNLKQFSKELPADTGMMAIIKADAYGHGATWVAEQALANGCEYLAVATLEEAIELRQAGITASVLLLSPYLQGSAKILWEYKITQTIASKYDAEILSQDLNDFFSVKFNKNTDKYLKVHLKIDTGMNRIGFSGRSEDSTEVIESILEISKYSNLELEGIFTHFAVADEPEKDFTLIQFERFQNILQKLEKHNLTFKIKHCSNSVAAIFSPQVALDYVRLGISIYGWCPNPEIKERLDLKPVMSFFSRISSIHKAEAGDPVGYGMTYMTDRETLIGTIEAGYADGMNRHLSNRGTVLINGVSVPIIGTVCMDRTMLDLTDVPNVKIGDEVLIFGRDSQENFRDLDLLAEQAGTISYEILCGISQRVPKILID